MPRPSSPEEMLAAIKKNMPAKTGKSFDEWVEVARTGPHTEKELSAWLKHEHSLGHVQAQFVAKEVLKPADYRKSTDEEMFQAQYAEDKDALRPIAEKVMQSVRALGGDASVEMRKTYASFNRRRQFGLVQPTSKTRVELGLALPEPPPASERLHPAGSLGSDRTNYKVALSSPEDFDDEVAALLRAAYEADA
jgi:hypothetical protein